MRKTILVAGTCLFLHGVVAAQFHKGRMNVAAVPEPKPRYQEEYTFDAPVNPEAWNGQKAGMNVSFGSTDKLYFRTEVPEPERITDTWEATGWRGERLNAQILVWAPDTIGQVRFTVSDWKDAKGNILEKNYVKLFMVRYVVSNYPYAAKDARCDATSYEDVYLMPDRFESFDRFHLPGKTVRPVWLSVDVPAQTVPGTYTGTVRVQSEKSETTLTVKIRVQNQALPVPREWKHRLDLWQNPWVAAWYNRIEPWSEDHKRMLEKHLQLYADAGGKYITTYAVHSPWADNSYMIEGSMIEWIKRKDGGWKFDYKIFDEYVQLAMKVGIDEAITVYTPIPWGNRFRYLDEATNNYVYGTWSPESEAFKKFWNVFLTDLRTHLGQKGWFKKTYLGINENPMNQTLAAIKVIKDHSKDWRITYAGDWHAELDPLLDDYCFLYGKESKPEQVKARSARGFTTTYYVCCNPPVPNNFVFSPPVEGRWLSWYTAAFGYDGFLRWAYDAWPADPSRDARHTLWPAGDCFLVYPGAASSIRFEKLREGIVDFEKIRIIKELAAKSTDKTVKKLMQELNQHLKVFIAERTFDETKITADVKKGNDIIEKLSDLLAGDKSQWAKSAP